MVRTVKVNLLRILLAALKCVNRLVKFSRTKELEERFRLSLLAKTDIFQWRIEIARNMGVKIGQHCRLYSLEFSSEPYLIEIGDHTVVSSHTQFITHDGGTWVFNDINRLDQSYNLYGKIKIGNNVFIGIGCIIFPNVEIGHNCVIGAGSVVRKSIPANSVVIGNPARVIMKLSLYEKMVRTNKNLMIHDPFCPKKHSQIKKKFGIS